MSKNTKDNGFIHYFVFSLKKTHIVNRKKNLNSFNRRAFLKTGGLASVGSIIPFTNNFATGHTPAEKPIIKFFGDGEMLEPNAYVNKLQEIQSVSSIVKDRYGVGGVIEALEKKFAEITGKEKAIYMPSGTMANQLAISVLSGDKSKVYVQDTSHVYRDEADAAQTIFNKRLMPLANEAAFFTLQQLQDAISLLADQEVFKTGIGAVSIENPVRRADGKFVPLEQLKSISEYCRNNKIGLHLDGARLYMAAEWTGVSIKTYASLFDTVYISLYKYLGATAGAILCGDKSVIDLMPHLIKVHGGSMYGNWINVALVLHNLDTFPSRLADARKRSEEIFSRLNKIDGIKIQPLPGGTNIYNLTLDKKINGRKLQQNLNTQHNIRIPGSDTKNTLQITVNETLLYQSADYIVNSFSKSL